MNVVVGNPAADALPFWGALGPFSVILAVGMAGQDCGERNGGFQGSAGGWRACRGNGRVGGGVRRGGAADV